jgi:DNA processing protein
MSLLDDFSDEVTCLSFLFLKGIGPKRGRKILGTLSRANGSVDAYVNAVSGVMQRGSTFSPEAARDALKTARSEIQEAEALGIKVIPVTSGLYPRNLLIIPDGPLVLFLLGDVEAIRINRQVAVVGTRKPSSKGEVFCQRITGTLVEGDVTIISGLAIGCDSIAHETCLELGGTTVAVMPCGLDVITPASNRDMAKRIVQSGGALVSEYPLGTKPRKGNYVQRNRIQSGLSDAVIIVEAALNSGTMETANHCRNQGRPLYSVSPDTLGNDADPGGNRKLIEGGAKVLKSKDGVLELIQDLKNLEPINSLL